MSDPTDEPVTYVKKPVQVTAMRYTGENFSALRDWVGDRLQMRFARPYDAVYVETLEGSMRVHAGDWIVKGTRGEYYPVQADPFSDTFEEVAE
jgi:hypothetical protein